METRASPRIHLNPHKLLDELVADGQRMTCRYWLMRWAADGQRMTCRWCG